MTKICIRIFCQLTDIFINSREVIALNLLDVVKGALLHDIGKFIQRGCHDGQSMTHQEHCYHWLSQQGLPGNICEFAARYHAVDKNNPKHDRTDAFYLQANELLIVCEADSLSSGERFVKDKSKSRWCGNTPLMSPFSRLSANHSGNQAAYHNCWQFQVLGTAENLSFPVNYEEALNSYRVDNYSSLFRAFEEEFHQLSPRFNENALLMLLEKYTSAIPSETQVEEGKPENHPDVSLFDHLKTTGAIAACLYQYLSETYSERFREEYLKEEILNRLEPRYLLVGGDFSGVQKFIYTISSKGALKTLRARSFFLELLTEHVVSSLLKEMGLTRANLVFSGGGRFYLLAPNTISVRKALGDIETRVNSYLYNSFDGRLFLALDKVEFCGQALMVNTEDKKIKEIIKNCRSQNHPHCSLCRESMEQQKRPVDMGQIWGLLRRRLTEKKNRKFAHIIADNPEVFWSVREPGEETCAVCHSETGTLSVLRLAADGDEPVRVCKLCKQLYELGDELPGAKYIAVSDEKPAQLPYICVEDFYYIICFGQEDLKDLNPVRVLVLNSWSVDDYLHPESVQMLTGSYAAKKGRSYKSFDELARDAVGGNRIGILRMDVDNLGTLFTRGQPYKARTFSRLSALSRNLTRFFKYHINQICRGNLPAGDPFKLVPGDSGRNVTIVYAGGDDLFLVGSWDDVTEVAFDIERCFKDFTGRNPDVTISGGITVQGPKYPLYRLAEMAGEAEEQAKANGRDSITLFYSPRPDFLKDGVPAYTGTFKWQQARGMLAEILQPAVNDLGVYDAGSRRVEFIFGKSLLHKLLTVSDIWWREGKLYLPRLVYVLARESERLKKYQRFGQWENWKNKVYKTDNVASLRIAVTWLDLLSRRGAEDGER